MDDTINFRKYVAYAVGALIALWLAIWLIHRLTTGTISVTVSGSQNTVTITGSGNSTYRQQAADHLSVRVRSGTYLITAQGRAWTTNKIVSLHARQNLKYSFSPAAVALPVPVTGVAVSNVSADDAQLFYVDPGGTGLYRIDKQNNVASVGNISLRRVKWAYSGYGVGQDSANRLYIVNGTAVTPLNTPSYDAAASVTYAINAGRQIYLAINKDVYVGNAGGGFQKIYTAQSSAPVLIPSPGGIGIVTAPAVANQKPLMTLLSSTGTVIKKATVDGGAVQWSPDGKNLALSVFQGRGEILDSSLNKVATLPGNTTSGNVWLDDNTLLYGSGNSVWSYNLNTKDSKILASLTPGSSISDLSLDTGKSNVYLAVGSSSGSELDRVSLHGQKYPSFAYQLDIFFPKTVQTCVINYVNFTSPTLSVTAPNAQVCPPLLSSELINDGLDTSSLRVNYINGPPVSNEN